MTITRRDRYYCGTRCERGTCDAKHGIAAADLEARILGGLQRLLVGNEALLQAFADEFRAEFESLRGDRQKDEAKLRRELAEVERSITRSLEFILPGDGAPASVWSKLQEVEGSKARLQAELASLDTALPASVEIHLNVPDLYRRKVCALADLVIDEDTRSEAIDIMRSLIERLEVGPLAEERGPCRVTLIGWAGLSARLRLRARGRCHQSQLANRSLWSGQPTGQGCKAKPPLLCRQRRFCWR